MWLHLSQQLQQPRRITSALLMRISAIVFLTTAVSSIVFQSTTFALPKIFDERLQGIARRDGTPG